MKTEISDNGENIAYFNRNFEIKKKLLKTYTN